MQGEGSSRYNPFEIVCGRSLRNVHWWFIFLILHLSSQVHFSAAVGNSAELI